jgi:uncharacterized protein
MRASWIVSVAALAVAASFCAAEEKDAGKKKILFFSPSFGFRHSVVTRPTTGELSYAEKEFKKFADKAGYEVFFSQDCHDLENEKQFKQYDAILLYTTGNPIINRDAFLKYVRDGGAIIGIHTATDSFRMDTPYGRDGKDGQLNGWPEYISFIGAAFRTHGPSHAPVAIKVEDPNSPATTMIPKDWKIGDEMYLFERFDRNKVHMLISIDNEATSEESLKGHVIKPGEYCPVAWTNTEGKGRMFYTSLGHVEEIWTNPIYQKHVLGGIAWALGQAEGAK